MAGCGLSTPSTRIGSSAFTGVENFCGDLRSGDAMLALDAGKYANCARSNDPNVAACASCLCASRWPGFPSRLSWLELAGMPQGSPPWENSKGRSSRSVPVTKTADTWRSRGLALRRYMAAMNAEDAPLADISIPPLPPSPGSSSLAPLQDANRTKAQLKSAKYNKRRKANLIKKVGAVNLDHRITCPLCPRKFNRNGAINHL